MAPVPEVESEPGAAPAPTQSDLDALEGELERERQLLSDVRSDNEELRAELATKSAELTSLEERYAALEAELSSTLEEVLRSKASLRGVQSRALATSRISEVRVQLGSVPGSSDPEVSARLGRAEDFLTRADQELEAESFGGALYLAERASELVRQAGAVAEVRRTTTGEVGPIIPVVPPRAMTVVANSNLRRGPGTDHPRVGGVKQGETVLATARSGAWFRVETESGLEAWILGRLVE